MDGTSKAPQIIRRIIQVFSIGLVFCAVQIVPIRSLLAAGGKPLLLLADAHTLGTDALEAALAAAGYELTVVLPEYSWNGTNPPLDGFQAVIHLNGATFLFPLPVSAQEALVEFVRAGGGYIGGQFNGAEQVLGIQTDMPDLVLQLYPHPDDCTGCNMTWTVVPGQEEHPVLEGVPWEFTFFADAHDAGPFVDFDQDPSTILMTSPRGGPAVIVRELENGRIVSFSSASNWQTDRTLRDFNILTLYVNAADWVTRSFEAPPVPECNAPETITPPDAPLSFTATADGGTSYEVEIANYDCYLINGSGKRIDKSESCQVSYTGDTLTVEESGGVGTHITWTAISRDSLGNLSEEAHCELEVVIPGKAQGKR